MESLKGKVTIITGAGSGFGRCTALYFAKYGAKLSLVDMNLKGTQSVAQECKALGLTDNDVLVVEANITNQDNRKSIVEETVAKFGKIDVLVNNAGIFRPAKITETSPELYDTLMDVNLKSQIYLSNLAVPYLKQTKGSIVNISSIVGTETVPQAGVYCLAKTAIDCVTRIMALELSEFGVRVNSVRPGTMHTGLYDECYENVSERMKSQILEHPMGRLGKPEEIAQAIAMFASDIAPYSTGNHLSVDGGRLLVGARYNRNIHPTL